MSGVNRLLSFDDSDEDMPLRTEPDIAQARGIMDAILREHAMEQARADIAEFLREANITLPVPDALPKPDFSEAEEETQRVEWLRRARGFPPLSPGPDCFTPAPRDSAYSSPPPLLHKRAPWNSPPPVRRRRKCHEPAKMEEVAVPLSPIYLDLFCTEELLPGWW